MSDDVLIRDFFNEQLDTTDRVAFEKRYANDPAFRAKVDEMEIEILAIRTHSRLELKGKFDQWNERNLQPETPIKSLKPYSWIGAAASVILIISVGLWTLLSPSSDELFTAYYQTYENYEITTTRNDPEHAKTPLENAFEAYDQGQYELAITRFGAITPNHPRFTATLFFQGISYVELERYSESITVFQQVVALNHQIYTDAAKWYEGLVWLKQKNKEKAKALLQELANGTGEYQESAQALLEAL